MGLTRISVVRKILFNKFICVLLLINTDVIKTQTAKKIFRQSFISELAVNKEWS